MPPSFWRVIVGLVIALQIIEATVQGEGLSGGSSGSRHGYDQAVLGCYAYDEVSGFRDGTSERGFDVRATGCAMPDPLRTKFTGKDRDGETGLDYFGARYLGAGFGRFTSPDPENAGATAFDSQSWNMFAYGRNNPLKYTDPNGMNYTVCDADGKNCRDLSDQQYEDYRNSSPSIYQNASGMLFARNDIGQDTKVGSAQYYNEKPFQALSLAGNRAGRDISTGAILIGGFATAYAGTYVIPVVVAALASAAATAPTVAVVFRAQQLTHAMRIEPGHSTPAGAAEEIKAAVGAAVKAGSFTVSSGGVVKGTAYIHGIAHEFTGFMRTAGEIVFSNIYRK